jgi:glycerol-3-phosphate dehydrogenase
MPISEAVVSVLYEGIEPPDMVRTLMLRDAKPEFHGIQLD